MTQTTATLTVDAGLLEEARALGIDPTAASEASLREAVQVKRATQWRQDNRAALDSSNAWVEQHGLPLAQHRQF